MDISSLSKTEKFSPPSELWSLLASSPSPIGHQRSTAFPNRWLRIPRTNTSTSDSGAKRFWSLAEDRVLSSRRPFWGEPGPAWRSWFGRHALLREPSGHGQTTYAVRVRFPGGDGSEVSDAFIPGPMLDLRV